jgi:hypothetical protein
MSAALALSLVFLPVLAASDRAASAPPDAADVMDRYVEATGGKKAHDAVQTSVTRMTLTLPAQDISFALTAYGARPNKVYTVLESDVMGKIESGADGEIAWDLSTMMGPRLKEGQEKEDALRDATFGAMGRWREVYAKVELAGEDTVGGRTCDKVLMTPKTGKPRTAYFERETGLLRRVDITVESPAGVVTAQTLLGDYREVGQLLVPYRTEVIALGQTRLMTVESIEHNVDLPPDRFDPPAEVKELLEVRGK